MHFSNVHRLLSRITLPIFKNQTACVHKNYTSCLPDLSEIENTEFSAFSSDTDNMTDGCTDEKDKKQILDNIGRVMSLLQKLVAQLRNDVALLQHNIGVLEGCNVAIKKHKLPSQLVN